MGFTANVVQHTTLRISQVAVERAALISLRQGRKTLKSGSRRWMAHGGDVVVVAGGQVLDVLNERSPEGLFEARWVVWDDAVLRQAGTAARTKAIEGVAVLKEVGDGFRCALERAVHAIHAAADVPEAVARHRLAELLVWLAEHGLAFPAQREPTLVARLRNLCAGALSEPWTAALAAERLAMSEATLRRRLGVEGTTFGQVLADARMAQAMTLLQSTDRAVSHIAWDVGYASASRFSVRFRDRFGFAPSAVRGHRR